MCKRNALIQKYQHCMMTIALFAFVLFFPCFSFAADDLNEICHTEIHSLESEYLQTEILSPVHYKYEISIDKECQFRIIPTAQMPMVCNKATQEIIESPNPEKQIARIEAICQFRRPGTFFIPPIQFEISSDQGQNRSYFFPQMQRVDVTPLYPQNDAPLDRLTKLQPWTPELSPFWLILFGTLILAFGSAIGFALFEKNKQQKTIEEIKIPPKPIEVFLAQIAPLVDITPTTIEEYKSYYDRLSYALRVYLSEKFELEAMSSTTYHLRKLLLDHGISERLCDEIKHILSESDMVKFAQEMPSQAANILLLKNTSLVATRIEEDFPDHLDNPEQTQPQTSSNTSMPSQPSA